MNSMIGEQSICFEKPPYLFASASVAGKKEGEGLKTIETIGTIFLIVMVKQI